MGKPRLIIIVRHAQSEGNKNREIHQSTPDHRVPLTAEGWQQAHQAGRKLRQLLRPTDTVHLFVSPYLRTRQTAEGMLSELTSDDPEPSPFPRHTIKVYEEPRLREQDFGNFQPSAEEMSRMWQERANYGHFFYRIPNGESAADAYDRVSGFNDSLWRRFEESDFASVCILVTHGLMSRVFLMKWYHFSVEYFEDLRNINHCEFVVMKKDPATGKYVLQNQLRTWTEYKRERLTRGSISQPDPPIIPMRRKWGGCLEGCTHDQHNHTPQPETRKPPVRQNTADLFNDDNEPIFRMSPRQLSGSPLAAGRNDSTATVRPDNEDAQGTILEQMESRDRINADQEWSDATNGPQEATTTTTMTTPGDRISLSKISLPFQVSEHTGTQHRNSVLSLGGRDGGGSKSGGGSVAGSSTGSDGSAEGEETAGPEGPGPPPPPSLSSPEGAEEGEEEEIDPLTLTQKHVKVPWPTNGSADEMTHQQHQHQHQHQHGRSLARALKGKLNSTSMSVNVVDDSNGSGRSVVAAAVASPTARERVMADALGDQSEDEKTDVEERAEKEREKSEMRKIVEEEERERSVQGSVY